VSLLDNGRPCFGFALELPVIYILVLELSSTYHRGGGSEGHTNKAGVRGRGGGNAAAHSENTPLEPSPVDWRIQT
jgi:hypothetical protein